MVEKDDLKNPLHLKLKTLPEEQICGLCDRKVDILFPINDVLLCLPCAEYLAERTDIPPVHYKLYQDVIGRNHCARCGRPVVIGVKASFHICHDCTVKLAKVEQGIRAQEAANARKIAEKYDIGGMDEVGSKYKGRKVV